jgi:hypothetical protein
MSFADMGMTDASRPAFTPSAMPVKSSIYVVFQPFDGTGEAGPATP